MNVNFFTACRKSVPLLNLKLEKLDSGINSKFCLIPLSRRVTLELRISIYKNFKVSLSAIFVEENIYYNPIHFNVLFKNPWLSIK